MQDRISNKLGNAMTPEQEEGHDEAIKVLRGMLATGLDLSPGLMGKEAEAVTYALRYLEARKCGQPRIKQ
jgi:hypothetical protein